jgi:nicotinamidase-related amidase
LPARDRYRQKRYSAFAEPRLIEHLRQRETDALIVSGSETDVCVLATVRDAVDIGSVSSSFATLYAAPPTKGTTR